MNPEYSLRDYQAEHCAFHITRRASLNYSACATGKTYTMAWLAEYYWKSEGCRTVLINPISLSVKNRDEMVRFTDFGEDEVQIVSGTPSKRAEQWKNAKAKIFIVGPDLFGKEWERMLPDVKSILVDESHLAYSGHKSARTQAFYRAQKQANHITFFTATPLSSGKLSSVYPFLAIAAPKLYSTYNRFMNIHAVYNSLGFLTGWKNVELLGRNLKPLSVGISFEKAFPDASKNIVSFETCGFEDSELERLYKEMEDDALAELENEYLSAPNSAVQLLRCRQFVSCPETLGYTPKVRAKDELLKSHLQHIVDGSEKCVLVFSSFVAEQERTVGICKEMGLSVALINGSTSGSERGRIADAFAKGEIQVLVASVATMAVGFNMEQNTSSVIFLSCDWNNSSYHQAIFRANRGTRKTALPIYVLCYNCKVEKKFWKKLLNEKESYKRTVDFQLKC